MTNQRQPNLQTLAALPVIAHVVDGQLEALEEQYVALQQAHDQPGSMDDGTIEHVLRVFTETKQLMPIYDLQVEYWRGRCSPSLAQRREIDRLAAQITKSHAVIEHILALAAVVKTKTIETLMGNT
ncbi:hypothetical protein IIE18_12140 [Pseudomonas sp. V1]|uniref:hypothetical protein n=1 Tax=Pseudomonas arcuscaelestis TaxID=2710591 RepID=UPI00193F637E|nr:hypothetical protein [Pseudomonas arcuscaelestis]MBM3105888.1 hypothetical protein [Pseudomonas arcuscaelestis]